VAPRTGIASAGLSLDDVTGGDAETLLSELMDPLLFSGCRIAFRGFELWCAGLSC